MDNSSFSNGDVPNSHLSQQGLSDACASTSRISDVEAGSAEANSGNHANLGARFSALRERSALARFVPTHRLPAPLAEAGELHRRQQAAQTLIRRWVWKMAIATLALMAVGSATRVMNAGLACPDWPLCYGQLVPTAQMNLQVFLEWFHRFDASLIGLMAIGLVGLSQWYRKLVPGWLPWAALGSLGLILVQGLLGGLTVTQLLRFDIVTAHLGTALLFFCALLAIAMALTPYKATGNTGRLPVIGLVAALLVYGQSILGGLVASRWAAHQCFGLSELCQVINTHIGGVLPPTLAVLILVISVWRQPALDARLRWLANGAGALVLLQIALGVATLKLRLQIEPLTVSHQMVGAMLLGSLVCFTVLGFRDTLAAPLSAAPPSATGLKPHAKTTQSIATS